MVGAGEPLSVLGINGSGRAGQQSYLGSDAQGSLVGSTDKAGASAGSAAYGDFGSPLSAPQSSMTGVPGGSSKTVANYQDFGYLGQPFDWAPSSGRRRRSTATPTRWTTRPPSATPRGSSSGRGWTWR